MYLFTVYLLLLDVSSKGRQITDVLYVCVWYNKVPAMSFHRCHVVLWVSWCVERFLGVPCVVRRWCYERHVKKSLALGVPASVPALDGGGSGVTQEGRHSSWPEGKVGGEGVPGSLPLPSPCAAFCNSSHFSFLYFYSFPCCNILPFFFFRCFCFCYFPSYFFCFTFVVLVIVLALLLFFIC